MTDRELEFIKDAIKFQDLLAKKSLDNATLADDLDIKRDYLESYYMYDHARFILMNMLDELKEMTRKDKLADKIDSLKWELERLDCLRQDITYEDLQEEIADDQLAIMNEIECLEKEMER